MGEAFKGEKWRIYRDKITRSKQHQKLLLGEFSLWICDFAESLKKVKGAATLTSVKELLGHIHLNSRMEGDPEAILKKLEATAKSEEYEGVVTLQAIKEIAATV